MDDLRLAVVTGVVVVHVIGTYGVDVGWYEQGPSASPAVLAVLAGPAWFALLFGLAPLFALAGWFAALSVGAHGVAGFVRRRLVRLGLPLAAYVLVIGPVAAFLAAGPGRGSWPGLRDRLTGWGGHDLGPAWFIAVLLALSLIFGVLAVGAPQLASRRDRPDGVPTILLGLAAVALAVSIIDVLVWWRWPYTESSPWNLNPAHWPQAAGAFALGVLAYRGRWFEPLPLAAARVSGLAALVGVAGLGLLAGVVVSTRPDYRDLAGGGHWTSLVFALADGLIAIGATVWIVGVFRAHARDRRTGWTKHLSRGSYATYLLHSPLVVAIALLLQRTGWPADAQLIAVVVVATPICLLVGAGVARLPILDRML